MELVECISSTTYPEKPIALTWQGERREILEILSRWRTPEGPHFRVCTADEQIFILAYDESGDTWSIEQP